jgi:hypothetical protein
MFEDFLKNTTEVLLPQVFYWTELFAVFWVPAIVIPFAWSLWVKYVRKAWLLKQKFVLLEVKLPAETFKSPAAMELVLTALHQTGGEGTPLDRYWEGKVRPWFSLELVSHGGDIHFYIWTFEGQKNFLTANIYAQYPDVAIHEVEDYTKDVFYDPKKYELWGFEAGFTKPDPYPIKTYVEYGLEDQDEEFKVDPMAPMIEFLGTLKPGHNAWIQIIVRAHKKEKTVFNNDKADPWVDDAKKEIEKIIEESSVKDKDGVKVPSLAKLTKGKTEVIASIERSISKYGFDTGIRAVYIAPKESFDRGNQGGLAGSFKQYGANNFNGFKPCAIGYDYKWQDWKGKKVAKWKLDMFKAFYKRSYFWPPYKSQDHSQKPMILNTEELATIYHFPGSAVRTPNLKRIPSKRADAPSNLPI